MARRISLLRVAGAVLLVVAVAGLGAWLTRSRWQPWRPTIGLVVAQLDHSARRDLLRAYLLDRYGKPLYSEDLEEVIIRHFFADERGGFFLDVGSAHPRRISTTYYLEKHLDWRGIAIDAQVRYAQLYAELRPNTRFFAFFVSDHSDDVTDFFVNKVNPDWSTKHREFGTEGEEAEQRLARRGKEYERVDVKTITLDDLLENLGVESIDFLSMDIELEEPKALSAFSIDRYHPALVCIEDHAPTRSAINAYFAAHDYVKLRHYSGIDPLNAYFSPRSVAAAFLRRDQAVQAAIDAELERSPRASEPAAASQRPAP